MKQSKVDERENRYVRRKKEGRGKEGMRKKRKTYEIMEWKTVKEHKTERRGRRVNEKKRVFESLGQQKVGHVEDLLVHKVCQRCTVDESCAVDQS